MSVLPANILVPQISSEDNAGLNAAGVQKFMKFSVRR